MTFDSPESFLKMLFIKSVVSNVNFIALSLVILGLNKVKCSNGNNSLLFLVTAFQHISKVIFKANPELTMINYDSDPSILNLLLSKTSQITPYKLKSFDKSATEYEIHDSGILTFKSVKSLIEFNRKTNFTNLFAKPLQFFVHCQSVTVRELSALKETKRLLPIWIDGWPNILDRSEIVHFQYFFIEEVDFIRLMTIVFYTSTQCDVPQLIEVNRFVKMTGRWKSSTFVIKKFYNFHGCNLVFGVLNQPPALSFEFNDGKVQYWGYTYEILTSLARHINYTFDIEFETYLDENMAKIDFMLLQACYHKEVVRMVRTFITHPYILSYSYLAVPPGDEYDGYEKLLLPFDGYVWSLITLTFAIAILVIFLTNLTNHLTRSIVFGQNVTTPLLNVAMIFFGISQNVLPARNFARFIVMLFILYCLIIRTAWQAKMFEFMQQEMRKPQISSIDEMLEKNYLIHASTNFQFYFAGSDIVER